MLLDEDVDVSAKHLFPKKVQVYTVPELGLSGKEDRIVIEEGVRKKCLIVTANKDFVPEYRKHEWRKGKDGRFFYGLIFLKESRSLTRIEQLKLAMKKIDYKCDDIITVTASGEIKRERIDEREPYEHKIRRKGKVRSTGKLP